MNKVDIIFIIFIFIFFISCSNEQDRLNYIFNTERTSAEWESKLKDLGYSKSLNNTVLLITHTTHCSSCLSELEKWNSVASNNSDIVNIFLVVIERYENRYQNFILRHAHSIDSLQDSSSVLLKEDFIPSLPSKIFFDVSGKPVSVHTLGGDIFLDEFIDNLGSIDDF